MKNDEDLLKAPEIWLWLWGRSADAYERASVTRPYMQGAQEIETPYTDKFPPVFWGRKEVCSAPVTIKNSLPGIASASCTVICVHKLNPQRTPKQAMCQE